VMECGVDSVVPERGSPTGVEPFCAWYSGSSLAPMERFLAEGGGSASDLVTRLPRVHRLPLPVTAQFGDPHVLFRSVNTPQDLAWARAIADAAQ
jgi:molybdopterin-guanine dinucleotide biosynthesis protein A